MAAVSPCITRCLRRPYMRTVLSSPFNDTSVSSFHSDAPLCVSGVPQWVANSKITRKANKQLTKMINRTVEREKIRKSAGQMMDPTKFEYDTPWSSHRVREFEPRRVRVVEHLLMSHISELLATEEFSSDFVDLSVEITTVQLAKGYGLVNVLWIPINNAPNQVAYDKLRALSARLRQELNAMQLMGKVPRIEFVQDRTATRLRELEANFSQVEFDQPPADGLDFTEGDIMEITVSAHPVKGVQTTVTGTEINPLDFGDLPEKRHDLGGLDRDAMMNQLIGTTNKPFKKPARA
ncbi:hypothetical protein RvY_15377 [Ramazzottius varieornatus]|uniref:Ribosome-binding factor A n=1 Tax=Ramazzottius varieornatus TaxID=947166 RepID=A0A1D1W2Q9_RAMVA|nr:hypothetical protein RvY_15377 [Ramazzottius varieornatus]